MAACDWMIVNTDLWSATPGCLQRMAILGYLITAIVNERNTANI